jgi:hypothetical protein
LGDWVRPDHGDRSAEVLAQLYLAGEEGDRAIRVDADPRVQIGRLQQGARQRALLGRQEIRLNLPTSDLFLVGRRPGGPSGRAADRAQDAIVFPAAAQVARHLGPDLGIGRMRVPIQQGLGGDNHSRDAKPTLDRVLVDKGLLQRVQAASRPDPLQRGDRPALDGTDGHLARRHGLSIDDHPARAALSQAAAKLGPL